MIRGWPAASRDERLVAKCDVDGILHVFERWDIYDIETLQANLESSYAELQEDLAPVAARSFLGLLKSTLGTVLDLRRTAYPPGHRRHCAAGRRQDDGARTPAARERQVQGVQVGQ